MSEQKLLGCSYCGDLMGYTGEEELPTGFRGEPADDAPGEETICSAEFPEGCRQAEFWQERISMTSDSIRAMLNRQITKELYSAYLYLAMANYYADLNLDGFANWFEVQAKEELDHALLFRTYLLNDDARVRFERVEGPAADYTQPSEPLEAAFIHEQAITASISEIYSAALAERDYKTTQFLDWFIKEQGEEEKSANDLCKKFELYGSDGKGLYMLNAELLTRVYAPPSLVL